ncbi:MAG: zinc metallopeptidase [Gammaproteobacteria bacterium]|nr:zinc metallopeptidase [Gammaproteobacteria bacterium]
MAIAVIALLLALVFLPQLWARYTLQRYARPREDFPGTGGELAAHLVRNANLTDVTIEQTEAGDHYDPVNKHVRLSAQNYGGRSLTAIVVAAHEVGHAIQDHIGYGPLRQRTRLVGFAVHAERIGAALLVAMPFITMLTRVPASGLVMLLAGLLVLGLPVLVHLATLPVEFDASFRRALPILATGYLRDDDLPAARRILLACALTYVAASLATLLNFFRWIQILRR